MIFRDANADGNSSGDDVGGLFNRVLNFFDGCTWLMDSGVRKEDDKFFTAPACENIQLADTFCTVPVTWFST